VRRFPRTLSRFQSVRIRAFADIPKTSDLSKHENRWLVQGYIPGEALTLIVAPPASFKTWIGLTLAGAVSQGRPFLERETQKCLVLYLDRDNPIGVIRERLKILHLNDDRNFKIWGNWLQDSPALIDDERLETFARTQRPLIIFDPFVRFHQADENSATGMAEVMSRLRTLSNLGATIVLLHHGPKSRQSAYRGSTDILAGVDMAFELDVDRTVEPPILTLKCFKNRFDDEFSLTIRPRLNEGQFEITRRSAKEQTRDVIERLRRLIAANPGCDQQRLIADSALPERRVRTALRASNRIHWIEKKGKRKALLYYPVEKSLIV